MGATGAAMATRQKMQRFQFCMRYGWNGNNLYVYDRVFGLVEFKYAILSFQGAKGVAIATKFRQK